MRLPKVSVSALLIIFGGAATFVVVAALLFIAGSAKTEARERFFEQYNNQQLVIALQGADTIEQIFSGVQRDLTMASRLLSDISLKVGHSEEIGRELRKIYDETMDDNIIAELVVFNKAGTVVGMSPLDAYTLGRDYSWRQYYKWARDEGRPGLMYLSPFMKMEGGKYRGVMSLMAVLPLYDYDGGFRGVIGGLINFDALVRSHVLSIRLGKAGYAWLLDNDSGSILVDPNQRVSGLTFEQAFLPRWQKLYDLAESTGSGAPGMDWYDFEEPGKPENTVRKLVAHAPVRIGTRLWTIGVCTPVPEVESLIGALLSRQAWLASLSIGVTLFGAAILVALLVNWNRLLQGEVDERTKDLGQAREKLEATFDELLSERKNSALGRLALGLAHEIRNPLFSISMNMQMIRRKIRPEGSLDESFGIVEGEVGRLNRLIGQVMGFARPVSLKLSPTDLSQVVEKTLKLMEGRLSDSGVKVEKAFSPGMVALLDPDQIQQLVWNLLLNALDAMEQGAGIKTLKIAIEKDEERRLLVLSVADTGQGINDEDRDKLFDPFFTTKAEGGGLGLSIAMTIAHRHDGTIEAENAKTGGAVFTVRLPLSGPAQPGRAQAEEKRERE